MGSLAKSLRSSLSGAAVRPLAFAQRGLDAWRRLVGLPITWLRGSLRNQIILLACLLVAVTSSAMAALMIMRTAQLAYDGAIEDIANETRLMGRDLVRAYDNLANDVSAISRMPPLDGLMRVERNGGVDPVDGSTFENWRMRLETIFGSVLESRPAYTQLRFIGVADDGREIVRVNRTPDGIEPVRGDDLQSKAQEPYFQEALARGSDELFFSDFTYNREHGRIDPTRTPTLRAILPILDPDGELFGIIIANADYSELLGGMLRQTPHRYDVIASDVAGNVLQYEPDTRQVSFFERDEHEGDIALIMAQIRASEAREDTIMVGEDIVHFTDLGMYWDTGEAHAIVAARAPRAVVMRTTWAVRREVLVLSLAMVLLSFAGALAASRQVTAPIQRMADAVRHARRTRTPPALPVERPDEIGEVARTFRDLAGELLERYEIAVNGAAVGIWDWNLKTDDVYWSPRLREIFGVSGAFRPSMTKFESRLHPLERDAVSEALRRHFETHEPYEYEHRLLTDKNGYIWIHVRGQTIWDDAGDPVRMAGSVFDITENKKREAERIQAQAALAESEMRARAVLENVIDAVITIDEHGVIASCNPACEAVFGHRGDDLVGKNISMLMPQSYASQHDAFLAAYRETGERKVIGATRELQGLRADGTVFPMELSVSEITVTGERVFTGIVRDITERKQAEELNARSAHILESSLNEIYLFDASSFFFLQVNEGARRNLGYTSEELEELTPWDIKPEYSEAEFREMIAPLQSGEAEILQFETVHERKDGTTYPVDVHLQLFAREAEPVFVAIIADITERKYAEEQREQFIDELTESNEERGHFAYVASHDLQQHLRMVFAFSSLLTEQYGDTLDEKAREYLGHVSDGAAQMRELIDDLLEYGRLGAETGRIVRFDADESVSQVIKRLEPMITESDAEVTCDPLPSLVGNPVRFARLMQNLISNAIKYVPADVAPRVHVSVNDEGEFWRFSVKDNGIGIDPAYQMRIFEPFKRLHARSEYAGSGLGLAICDKIVKGFDGRIWVESSPQAGSTFHFTVRKTEDSQ